MQKEVRPDFAAIERGLKDFQRATAQYVFRRLYTDKCPTRRFLIADEVGLGKTLVARGVIARAIDYLWEKVDRIDVVYICSNADIARQNINRLNVTGQDDFALASRITLLPLQSHELNKRKLNFISFTPGTSFELKSNLGRSSERVLIYRILEASWQLRGKAAPLNVMCGNASLETFKRRIHESNEPIDQAIANAFLAAVEKQIAEQRSRGEPDLRTRFDMLCACFARSDSRVDRKDYRERNAWVGGVRALLAKTCLGQLQPDLIILDEFQRFKNLLSGEDEASQLAHDLFEYVDDQSKARVLLLSATPYKMYTLAQEEGEDHYTDFISTLRFLLNEDAETSRLEELLEAYRRAILASGESTGQNVIAVKSALQECMRRVMVRTERLASTIDRNGMLAEVPAAPKLDKTDILSFLALDGISREIGKENSVEYWKSGSYLLNFMEDYELKRAFQKAIDNPVLDARLAEKLAAEPNLLLPWHQAITRYGAVDPRNPRLRALQAETIDRGAWRILWIPPSLPYYQLEGPFAHPGVAGFTKKLVFSSWKVVPRVLASLLSYEAERRMITSFDPSAANTQEERVKRSPLLRFQRSEGRLTGLPLMALIYPSAALASSFDPLRFYGPWIEEKRLPSVSELIGAMAPEIRKLIEKFLPQKHAASGPEDDRWYWLTPMMMDMASDKTRTRAWWSQDDLAFEWSSREENAQDEEDTTAWVDHVAEAKNRLKQWEQGNLQLGRPPEDLAILLAQLAIAGPGVVMLRSLSRLIGNKSRAFDQSIRSTAARTARSFLSLFNLPEAMHLIRGLNSEEPYWRRVVEYCVSGGLQPVMDEYAHFLKEALGLLGEASESSIEDLAGSVQAALALRTATMAVDEIEVGSRSHHVELHSQRMRNRFAVRFGEERAEGTEEVTRSDQVRAAFNSPFWPFVLATTSVGQEGLDFHPYCHVVVHWNLPSNPVDLEQREGRVHRYKGHAIRKNLASRFSVSDILSSMKDQSDPWDVLFQLGIKERIVKSDIVPFWVYPVEGGARIERRLMVLPLSREAERAALLRKSLSVYRMVFGQPRQEDLISYLLAYVPRERIDELGEQLRIDLSPPVSS